MILPPRDSNPLIAVKTNFMMSFDPQNFEQGNFSAKYIDSPRNEAKNDSRLTINRDVSNGNPDTIQGGFPAEDTDRSTNRSLFTETSHFNAEDPHPDVVDVVGRHLAGDNESSIRQSGNFDSLKLQGGDVTRELYNWVDEHDSRAPSLRRSSSFHSQPGRTESGYDADSNDNDMMSVSNMKMPGGMRRNFLMRQRKAAKKDSFFTRNFIEFLSLYGQFAGENLREEDSASESESDIDDEDMESNRRSTYGSFSSRSQSGLLQSLQVPQPRSRPKISKKRTHKVSTSKSVMLLLKAFIGTGVLFLPKSFSNGGVLFANAMLGLFSVLSYICFVRLVSCRVLTGVSSYGDIGLMVFGSAFRNVILAAIVLSQIGFSSAYIVFVAENMKSVANSFLSGDYTVEGFIFMQLLVFIPLSLTRDLGKLSSTALIADAFILLGLVYVYYVSGFQLIEKGVASPLQYFNKETWSLFIGTAVFTYEGIGLLIPIQESMRNPQDFNKSLFGVMVAVTIVFTTIGTVCYLSYGDNVETVILLNFPQNHVAVKVVQLMYATAILLSTPLQLFPGIKILENCIFTKKQRKNQERELLEGENVLSGKEDPRIKWLKNSMRLVVVVVTCVISYAGAADLDKFVSLIGSVTCVPLIYIFPPLLHMGALQRKGSLSAAVVAVDGGILVLGVVMMGYTGFQTVASFF